MTKINIQDFRAAYAALQSDFVRRGTGIIIPESITIGTKRDRVFFKLRPEVVNNLMILYVYAQRYAPRRVRESDSLPVFKLSVRVVGEEYVPFEVWTCVMSNVRYPVDIPLISRHILNVLKDNVAWFEPSDAEKVKKSPPKQKPAYSGPIYRTWADLPQE